MHAPHPTSNPPTVPATEKAYKILTLYASILDHHSPIKQYRSLHNNVIDLLKSLPTEQRKTIEKLDRNILDRAEEIEEAMNRNYRKCSVLLLAGVVEEVDDYDAYGHGLNGIEKLLKEKHISYRRTENDPCDPCGVIVVDSGDPGIYLVYSEKSADWCVAASISLTIMAAALRAAGLPQGLVDNIATVIYRFAAFKNSLQAPVALAAAAALLVGRVAAAGPMAASLVRSALKLANMDAKDLLNAEEELKEAMVSGAPKPIVSARMLGLLLGSIDLDGEELVSAVKLLKDSYGAALAYIHTALLAEATGPLRKPEDAEKLLMLLGGSDDNIILAIMAAKEYLSAVHELEGYYANLDVDVQSCRLVGRAMYCELGGADQHKVVFRPTGSVLTIKVYDHSRDRLDALEKFLSRALGLKTSVTGNNVYVLEATVPPEKIHDTAWTLATLPSVDIQRCEYIYRRATSLEDLLELRRQCTESSEGDDESC